MITTVRLTLRNWTDADRTPFAAMVADPEVMRFLGPVQDRVSADAAIERATTHQAEHGFTFWAVERRADAAVLGFCGLKRVDLPGTPVDGAVEIGWRLRRDAWGKGYAREAAVASLAHGFGAHRLPRIVAYTVPDNTRSWGLMERLGMVRRDDLAFDHPLLDRDNPLRPHIVYVKDAP